MANKWILSASQGREGLYFSSEIVRKVGIKPRTVKAGVFNKSGDNYWKLSLILTFVYIKLIEGQLLIVK